MALTQEQIDQARQSVGLTSTQPATGGGATPAPSSDWATRLANLKTIAAQAQDPRAGLTPTPDQPTAPTRGFLSNLANAGLGAVKGAVSTVKNAADLGEKIFDPVVNTLTGSKPTGKATDIIPPNAYTPSNTPQKIGKGIEQTAELFTPLGLESEGANLATKVAAGAAEFGGKTAIQTGGDVKQTGIAAATGGAGELAAAGISKLLERIPENAWSAILKRTPAQVAKNPNLPAQAAETGMVGTRNQIVQQAQSHIQQIEVALDDLLKGSDAKIGTLKIAPYLDELRNSYRNIPGEQGSVDTINNVMTDLLKQKSLTPLQANQMKRDIYGLISKSYGKGTLEIPAKTEAQKQIARGLKTEIEKVIPEAKSLNEKQAVYIQVNKALQKLNQHEGKGIAGSGVGLYDLMTGGVAEAAGLATGHPMLGLGAVATKKAAESAPVLSATAKLAKYFDGLSPTKQLLFKRAIEALSVKGTTSVGK